MNYWLSNIATDSHALICERDTDEPEPEFEVTLDVDLLKKLADILCDTKGRGKPIIRLGFYKDEGSPVKVTPVYPAKSGIYALLK